MQTVLFEKNTYPEVFQLNKEDLFKAYYDCRRNKRNSKNALAFEIDYEKSLFGLYDDIVNHKYEPKPGICFIVKKPVQREIFAGDFRDRIVHHLLYNYLSPIFEKTFINDSYSCRKGKGTHYGIKRVDHFIRSCSENYKKDCYILKLDIKSYFMTIDRALLFKIIDRGLREHKGLLSFSLPLVIYLLRKVIFNDPTQNCIIKGNPNDWIGLPNSKSLFNLPAQKGLPIGNLTSQLFGNIYMNEFDHFVKRELGIKYYGRYVDDFVLIHNSKQYLKSLLPHIRAYLNRHLMLELHPDKIYLQHISKGVQYLGAFIKPHRIYVSKLTKGNFFMAIQKQNAVARKAKPDKAKKLTFIRSMNSYLGILKHYKSYRYRKRVLSKTLSAWWWNYVFLRGGYGIFKLKQPV
jgi:RNA-directed DNA polymerase